MLQNKVDSIKVEANFVNDEPKPPAMEPQTHIPDTEVTAEGLTVEEAEKEQRHKDLPELINPDTEDLADEDDEVTVNAGDDQQTILTNNGGRLRRMNAGKKELDSDFI